MKRSLQVTASLAVSLLGSLSFATVAQAGLVATFSYTGVPVTYTVPTTGVYNILAYGAQGGASYGSGGGLGAEAGGDFALTVGQTLRIMVGGAGANGGAYSGISGFGGGGGGGASFVGEPYGDYISMVTPLVVAGGGGGGGSLSNGTGGTTTNTGTDGGGGGNGGGGFSMQGSPTDAYGNNVNLAGLALTMDVNAVGNGGRGGGGGGGEVTGYDMFSYSYNTLYCSYGGGGGGYSGGNGGYSSYCYGPASDVSVAVGQGGTGGGSFLADSVSNQVLLAAANSGNGLVTFALTSDIPEAGALELFGFGLAGLVALRRRRHLART